MWRLDNFVIVVNYFGTYTVNEPDKTLSLKIDGTTLVNQIGMEQKRVISSIDAKEMKYRNPARRRGLRSNWFGRERNNLLHGSRVARSKRTLGHFLNGIS